MQPEDIDQEARRVLALYVEAGYSEAPHAADPLSQLVSGLAGEDATRVVETLSEDPVGRQVLAVALMRWSYEHRRWQGRSVPVDVLVELDRSDPDDVDYRAATEDEHLMAVSSSILRVVGGLGVHAIKNNGPDTRVRFEMTAEVIRRVNKTNDA